MPVCSQHGHKLRMLKLFHVLKPFSYIYSLDIFVKRYDLVEFGFISQKWSEEIQFICVTIAQNTICYSNEQGLIFTELLQ